MSFCECGCGKDVRVGSRFLRGHYFKLMIHRRTPIVERFWNKVMKTDGCWEWTGARYGKNGYGWLGRGGNRGGGISAHRFSRELHYGMIPEGLEVLHHCDNKLCVRPEHLFLGTQSDNMLDCSRKGRLKPGYVPGEKCGVAKLTWEEVRDIREKYLTGTYSKRRLGRMYKVDHRNIKFIVEGKTWKENTKGGDSP